MITEFAGQFQQQGYVVVPDFFSATDLAHITVATDEHYRLLFAEQVRPESTARTELGCDVISWGPLRENHPAFLELRQSAALRELTADCLGGPYRDLDCLVMATIPGGRGQAWHQDCTLRDPRLANVNRLVYIRDVQPDEGAIVFVPGSHRRGRIPAGDPQESLPGEITLAPKAGTLVLLNGLCFHRVTPNQSPRPRLSVNFRVVAAAGANDACAVGVYRNFSFDFSRGQVVEA